MVIREKSAYFDRIIFYCLYDFFSDFCSDKCLFWDYYFSFLIFDIFEGDTIDEFSLSHFHEMIDNTKWSCDKSILIDSCI